MHRRILKWFGKNPWDDFKPFSCYFCTHFWLGCCVAIAASIAMFNMWGKIDFELICYFLMLNFIVSRVLDVVLGYESLKGK